MKADDEQALRPWHPYAEYAEPNHQLPTQSRIDDDGNMYLYAYNYCPDTYHKYSHIDSVKTESHGTNIKTEIKMDGMFVPYSIDAWSGKATELAEYRYEDGQTVFPIDIRKDHAGHAAGGRVRQFLTDEGYNEVVKTDGCGDVKIIVSVKSKRPDNAKTRLLERVRKLSIHDR